MKRLTQIAPWVLLTLIAVAIGVPSTQGPALKYVLNLAVIANLAPGAWIMWKRGDMGRSPTQIYARERSGAGQSSERAPWMNSAAAALGFIVLVVLPW